MTQVFSAAPESIRQIADLLKQGEVVALPTETVYGLAGNATSPTSVLKIFQAKERPSFDPLIVHVSEKIAHEKNPIQTLVQAKIVSPEVLKWSCLSVLESAMKHFWPGPLTFILPRGSLIPDEVTSGQNTVGLRCPAHPLFQAVLSNIDFPLAAPSANRFGRISPTQAQHVVQELDGRIAGILDGGTCSVGVESTIVKIEDPLKVTLLRPGKLSASDIETFFKVPVGVSQTLGEKNQTQAAPGMLDEHYAPRKPLILVPHSFHETESTLQFLQAHPESDRHAYLSVGALPVYLANRKHSVMKSLSNQNSLDEMAKNLFATLRELDQNPKVETIFCDIPTGNSGLAVAVRDRLKRASRNKPTI